LQLSYSTGLLPKKPGFEPYQDLRLAGGVGNGTGQNSLYPTDVFAISSLWLFCFLL